MGFMCAIVGGSMSREEPHGMVFAKTNTLAAEREWEILTAFIGFLDRLFHDEVASITIQYG